MMPNELPVPMIPAAIFAMLAIARIGAIHAVVFGGFSPSSLAQRMEASRPRAVMTASCGIEGNKPPTGYKDLLEEAIQKSSFKPSKTIIWQREQLRWDPVLKEDGQRNWQRLVKSARNRGLKADAVPVDSSDGLYIIYTSGTTGLPKGVVREAGGHAVGLNFSIKYLFGVHGPGDVMFTASDIGWVVGVSNLKRHRQLLYLGLTITSIHTLSTRRCWQALPRFYSKANLLAPRMQARSGASSRSIKSLPCSPHRLH